MSSNSPIKRILLPVTEDVLAVAKRYLEMVGVKPTRRNLITFITELASSSLEASKDATHKNLLSMEKAYDA